MSINIVSYNFIFILYFIIIFIISSSSSSIIIIIIIIILSYFATVETGHNVSSVVFLVF